MAKFSVQKGFTLIELVTVIVILGIVGLGISSFMGNTMLLFAGSVEREQLMNEGRFAVTRMQREMARAVPNSFRIAGNSGVHCVEFTPVVWPASYATAPFGSTSNRTVNMFWPHDPDGNYHIVANDQHIVIYPLQPADVYDQSRNRKARVTGCSDDGDGHCLTRDDSDDVIQVQVDRAFQQASPHHYAYFVNRTISYCVANGNVYRKEENMNTSQSLSLSGAVIVAEHVTNSLSGNPASSYAANDPLMVFAGSAGKSNFVRINLQFNDNGEQVNHFQEVHVAFKP